MSDRVVMVSGGNRGIGQSIVKRLHQEGFIVSVGVRNPLDIETFPNLHAFRYEAMELATAKSWLAGTIERFGRLDVIVNNAGIAYQVSNLDEKDDPLLVEMMTVNAIAPFQLSRLAIPHLERTHGRIVNIVSVSGTKYCSGESIGYTMSKFAAMAFSRAMDHILREKNIGVTAICPGITATAMTKNINVPEDLMLAPNDVAAAVSYVLSLPSRVVVPEMIVNDKS